MADITSTEVIKFCNEVVRPLSEELRSLDHRVQSALTQWYATISAQVPVDAEAIVQDGREVEGTSRLSGNDVTLLITQIAAYKSLMDGAGVRNVISKPCVRALMVT